MKDSELVDSVIDMGLAGGRGVVEFSTHPYGHPSLTHKAVARQLSGLGWQYDRMTMSVQQQPQQSVRAVGSGGGVTFVEWRQPSGEQQQQYPRPAACSSCPSIAWRGGRVQLKSDGTRPPSLSWPDMNNYGTYHSLQGRDLYNEQMRRASKYKSDCAVWVRDHCMDPDAIKIRERLQRQNAAQIAKDQSSNWRSTPTVSRILNSLTQAQQADFAAFLRSRGFA